MVHITFSPDPLMRRNSIWTLYICIQENILYTQWDLLNFSTNMWAGIAGSLSLDSYAHVGKVKTFSFQHRFSKICVVIS